MTTTAVQNVKLGACSVTYNAVNLGLTKGGVQVSMSTATKTITVDQFGQTIMNDIIQGRTGTVKVPMAEYDLTKLVGVIVGSSIVTDKTTSTKKKLLIPTAVGTSLLDTAAPLILHPYNVIATDLSQDVTIPLAGPTGAITFDYQFENERIYNVEFQMYPDPTSGLLLTFGDPTATAT